MGKSKFQKAIDDMQNRRETTIKRLGAFGEAETKKRTPVKTGHLRRGITHMTESDETKSVAVIGSNVEYDGIVELGLGGQPEQPHYRPAIQQNEGTIQKMIDEGLSLN